MYSQTGTRITAALLPKHERARHIMVEKETKRKDRKRHTEPEDERLIHHRYVAECIHGLADDQIKDLECI